MSTQRTDFSSTSKTSERLSGQDYPNIHFVPNGLYNGSCPIFLFTRPIASRGPPGFTGNKMPSQVANKLRRLYRTIHQDAEITHRKEKKKRKQHVRLQRVCEKPMPLGMPEHRILIQKPLGANRHLNDCYINCHRSPVYFYSLSFFGFMFAELGAELPTQHTTQ